jgi:N-acetylglucosaminyl-diphospho-decaprenol L-rhamnosyltransferase
MPDVCVTLVLYNSSDHLAACLDALRPDLEAGRAEIVAVDNASPDDSVAVLRREVPQAKILTAPENLGFAGGSNLAWHHVDARYWLLLNPDVILDPGTLAALVEWMDARADVGMAAPWLRDGGPPEFPGRAFPSAGVTLAEMTRLYRVLPAARREALLQGPYVRSAPQDAPDPGWLPATAVIARADAVRDVGLLDDAFFLYGEDLEWCWRMRRGGWRIAAAPVGGGTHHSSASSRRTWDEARVQERIAAGTLAACERMQGPMHARAFALAQVASLAMESWHSRRSPESRKRAATACRAWWKALRDL